MATGLPSTAELRAAARELWPERRLRRFRRNEVGWTNLVLEADGRWIFRFPRHAWAARQLGFEVRVLDYLSQHLSTPVPAPERIGVLRRPGGWPFVSYPKIPGVALPEFPSLSYPDRVRFRDFLARLLVELADLPTTPMLRLGCPAGDPPEWARGYVRLLERYRRAGAARVSAALDRSVEDEFARMLPVLRRAKFRPVVSHRDLGPYNLIWDPRAHRPTGVIDWEDVRLGDPAFDLTGLSFLGDRLLAPIARARRARGDATFDARLAFYRHVVPLQEMLHAVEHRNAALFHRKRRELRDALAVPPSGFSHGRP
jgi:aminoglycoside 2''-phosphotransferase